MKKILFPLLVFSIVTALYACAKRDASDTTAYRFHYTDSVLYLRNAPGDYIVAPIERRTGTYTGFPEGIEIDEHTGAINVSKSETGLRYRINFTADNGETFSTMVVISGINYADKYFNLSAHDTLVKPIYNADAAKALPTTGSVFDEGLTAKESGCAMGTVDGMINLASSIRNGLFGKPAKYGAAAEVETKYRLNDNSNKAQNGLKVKFYYYKTKSDVPKDLAQLLEDREGSVLRTATLAGAAYKLAKPRPPCIIVIAQ